jgi:hypothetical protein
MMILVMSEVVEMKMQEVKEKARALGIKKTFGLSKAELVRRIQRAEGNFDCFGTAEDHCDQFQCCFREDCFRPSVSKRD